MEAARDARRRITGEVLGWRGVTAAAGSRGELSFRVGRREIGHLHGDRVAHFAFPRAKWDDLIARGVVERHPVDRPGLAARRIESEADVDAVIELLRQNYERAVTRERSRT